jgi:hypothetical protein
MICSWPDIMKNHLINKSKYHKSRQVKSNQRLFIGKIVPQFFHTWSTLFHQCQSLPSFSFAQIHGNQPTTH